MLEIIMIIVMGKYFYRLAEKYEKSKWGYAILGVVTCYATVFIGSIIYTLIYFMDNPLASEDDINYIFVSLITIPFGIGASYLLYYLLEKNWKKTVGKDKVSIDDIGKGI